jgi:uncharacterized protein (DUF4415 family)
MSSWDIKDLLYEQVARIGKALGHPSKRQITLRIDAEVLEFFQNTGNRYQSRMNAVLRSYEDAHKAQVK